MASLQAPSICRALPAFDLRARRSKGGRNGDGGFGRCLAPAGQETRKPLLPGGFLGSEVSVDTMVRASSSSPKNPVSWFIADSRSPRNRSIINDSRSFMRAQTRHRTFLSIRSHALATSPPRERLLVAGTVASTPCRSALPRSPHLSDWQSTEPHEGALLHPSAVATTKGPGRWRSRILVSHGREPPRSS